MINLSDVQELSKSNPKTFEAPKESELEKIKVGDSVKVCINNKERLWVHVTEVCGNNLKGTIDNCPITLEEVSFGDLISFRKENVYSVFN